MRIFNLNATRMVNGTIIAHDQLKNKGGYATSLLVDDSAQARALYDNKGGVTYPYANFEDFAGWIDNNL